MKDHETATIPNKVPTVIKMEIWILAGLNVIRDEAQFRTPRTGIIEGFLVEGLKRSGLSPQHPKVKKAMKVIHDNLLAKQQSED